MVKNEQIEAQKMALLETIKPIFQALKSEGGEARLVGGAVRDLYMGRPINDIDLAVSLKPEDVIRILESVGMKVIPTGIDFGTVTVILNSQHYQITTLRNEAYNNGRFADVCYIDDWEEDAARRDFTINALYLDEEGMLYDYFGSVQDIQKRSLRFIGDATSRIKEDPLRILRFYRFWSQLSETYFLKVDDASHIACEKNKDLLRTLSAERIWQELSKLITGYAASKVWEQMVQDHIAQTLYADFKKAPKLTELLELGEKNSVLALALMIDPKDVNEVSRCLKLSKKDKRFLSKLFEAEEKYFMTPTFKNVLKLLYYYGQDIVRGVCCRVRVSGTIVDEDILGEIESWQQPIFPLTGKELMAEGYESGEALGHALRATETWWVEQDFEPQHQACLEKAVELLLSP